MSNRLALYRKYRPQTFDDVVGQRHIIQSLKNAIKNNIVAHAYLFCGPRGTGKTSIAKLFSRTLNCTSDHKPCGRCENCRLALSGTHPDIHEIDAASNSGVDEIRDLIENVQYAPIQGKYKVIIIDEVHMLTKAAFNALLKTIEEPPANTIFIFATTEPDKVIPTILSRCQRYDFSPVSMTDIKNRILTVAQRENLYVEEQAASLIASLANGGLRDALSILDKCIAYSPGKVTAEVISTVYGLATPDQIGSIFASLNRQQASRALDSFRQCASKGMDLKRFIKDFSALLKNARILCLQPDSPLVEADQIPVLKKWFLPFSSQKRSALSMELRDIEAKFSWAYSIQDYIELALLNNAEMYSESLNQPQTGTQSLPEARSIQPDVSIAPQASEPVQPVYDHSAQSSSPNPDVQPGVAPADIRTPQPWNSKKSAEEEDIESLISLLMDCTPDCRAFIEQRHEWLKHPNSGNFRNQSDYQHACTLYNMLSPEEQTAAQNLSRTLILGAAPSFIIVVAAPEICADIIDRKQNRSADHTSTPYETLLLKLLGLNTADNPGVDIYAVTPPQKDRVVSEFKSRQKNGTLPMPFSQKKEMNDADLRVTHCDQQMNHIRQHFPDAIAVYD